MLWGGVLAGVFLEKYRALTRPRRIYGRFVGVKQTYRLKAEVLEMVSDLDGVRTCVSRDWPVTETEMVLWYDCLLVLHPVSPFIVLQRAVEIPLETLKVKLSEWCGQAAGPDESVPVRN